MADFNDLIFLLIPYALIARFCVFKKWNLAPLNLLVFFFFFVLSRSESANLQHLLMTVLSLFGFSVLTFFLSASKKINSFFWVSLLTLVALVFFKSRLNVTQIFGISFFLCRHVLFSLERTVKTRPTSLWTFLSYAYSPLLFFIGPITSFDRFEAPNNSPKSDLLTLERLILGYFKLIFISQLFFNISSASISESGFSFSLLDLICGHLFDIFFVYFYLSGMSDISISLGRFLGHEIDENFNRPFLASNILEYWKRWHMSLAGFVRSAFYTPLSLGLSRRLPRNRRNLGNVLVTALSFILLGFLHFQNSLGLALGLYHLTGIVICHYFGGIMRNLGWMTTLHQSTPYRIASYTLTWLFISTSMVFFRFKETGELIVFLKQTWLMLFVNQS